MHEMAGEINSHIEHSRLETEAHKDLIAVVAAAAQTLRKLGQLLGLFRHAKTDVRDEASSEKSTALADQLMELIIFLRAEARKRKDFATADAIRDGLAKLKITVEDRPGGTGWRKD
jgi:cysteinyl-tRNA synthetase